MTITAEAVTGQPFSFKRFREVLAATGLQEGVYGAGDFLVRQRAAGANMSVEVDPGDALVTVDSGVRNGAAHAMSDAVENPAVGASHATLPRIDSVVLQYNDTGIPAGVGGNTPTVRVVAGTATAGATLDNRNGAPGGAGGPAFPNDALLLEDVLVPAASSSVVTANMRDRRRRARGAHAHLINAPLINGVTQTAYAEVPTTWRQRVEVSGLYEVRFSLRAAIGFGGGNDGVVRVQNLIDGAAPAAADGGGELAFRVNSNNAIPFLLWQTKNVAAGSHLFSAQWRSDLSTGTWFNPPIDLLVEEIIRPNAGN